MNPRQRRYRLAKRTLDLTLSLVAILVSFPLMLIVAVLVAWRMGLPVFFFQERIGLDERRFRVFKFRTMSDARDADGRLLPDEVRLTRLGRFLRSTSLDELPALFNILFGELSFVGPRPLPVRYLERYSARQRERHTVAAGLSGWAQIHGRNDIDWRRRFELDLWYVEHCSLGLDLRILAATVSTVLRRHGIDRPGGGSMPEFGIDPVRPANGGTPSHGD